MAAYQQMRDPFTGALATAVLRIADQAIIPADPRNRDYEAYLAWVAAGNTPDPAPAASPPPPNLLGQARAALALGNTASALDLLLRQLGA